MSIRYAAGNLVNVNTLISVSSEDLPYEKAWMYNARQAKPFRMDDTDGNIVFDLAAERPDIIGIMNHNLSGATITLEFDDDAPDWGDPADSIVLTPHTLNIWESFVKDFRWLRLVIAGNATNIELGEIILTNYGSFTRNYNWGSGDVTRYIKQENITKSGQRWRGLLAKGKSFPDLRFANVTDAHLVSEVEAFFAAIDGVNPFIFIPDHTEANCWYVYCLNNLEARQRFLNMNDFGLTLEEQTRGIELL